MPRGGRRRGTGPKPKPTELKVIQGTYRKDRDGEKPLDVEMPDDDDDAMDALERQIASELEPFAWLTPREQETWRLALDRFGAWTKTSDVFALAALVSLMSLYEQNRAARGSSPQASAMVAYRRRREGSVTVLEAREHPLVTQQLRILDSIRKWLTEFGGTPASRTMMREDASGGSGGGAPLKPADPFEEYLQKKRG